MRNGQEQKLRYKAYRIKTMSTEAPCVAKKGRKAKPGRVPLCSFKGSFMFFKGFLKGFL